MISSNDDSSPGYHTTKELNAGKDSEQEEDATHADDARVRRPNAGKERLREGSCMALLWSNLNERAQTAY